MQNLLILSTKRQLSGASYIHWARHVVVSGNIDKGENIDLIYLLKKRNKVLMERQNVFIAPEPSSVSQLFSFFIIIK